MDLVKNMSNKIVSDLYISQEVETCDKSDPILLAIEKMVLKNIGCIVIVENKIPIGIFTERDLLNKVTPDAVINQSIFRNMTVENYMTPNPVCAKPNTPFLKIMSAMRLGRFRHLVITDENGQLAGIISIKDVLNYITDSVYEDHYL